MLKKKDLFMRRRGGHFYDAKICTQQSRMHHYRHKMRIWMYTSGLSISRKKREIYTYIQNMDMYAFLSRFIWRYYYAMYRKKPRRKINM